MRLQRQEAENLLLLDTGDALIGGGPLGDQTRGEAIVAGMSLMGYDAMALGPNELALGPELLQQRMNEAQFPMLSANVVLSDTGDLLAEPYAVLQVGEHRVGVLALTRMVGKPSGGFQVLDPQQAAGRYVPEIARQANTVIVLTSLSYRDAMALAQTVPGIDLVIAALPSQSPSQAVRAPETGTIVVSAEQPVPRHSGRRVGKLVVTIESEGNLTAESWLSLPMDRSIPDDTLMTTLLNKYEQ